MNTGAIVLDVMGCDLGLMQAIDGAMLALSNPDIMIKKIFLVGQENEIRKHPSIATYETNNRLEVVHAQSIITTEESPTLAIKNKKDSSIVVGLNLIKDGLADAFVSAGSTGAVLTAATLIVGRIKGIKRPALATVIPSAKGYYLLIDCGANMDAKPEYILQFAKMGSVYVQELLDISRPRVGLINVGAEKEKGNALTKEAYTLLEAAHAEGLINFVGNTEGRSMPLGDIDVAVCDAFVGNVLLKYAEGFGKGILSIIKEELMADPISKVGALLSKPAYKRVRSHFDYKEVGGAPFLGLNALVVKAHGSSDSKAFFGAIRQANRFIVTDIVSKIKQKVIND